MSACGDSSTSAADAAPEVAAVCDAANENLATLVGDEPGERMLDAADGFLLDIVSGLRDVDADIGHAGEIVGDRVQAVRRPLREVQGSYAITGEPFDPASVEAQIVEAFPTINQGAAQFGLEECLDVAVLDDVLLPQLAAAVDSRTAVEPTGDFAIDLVAACERYRSNQTEVLIENVSDPNAEFLVFIRLRGIASELFADLERLTVPADRQAAVAAALTGIEEYRDAVDSVESGRLASQAALDSAIAAFSDVEGSLDTRLRELEPDC